MNAATVSATLAFAVFGMVGVVLIVIDVRRLRLPTPAVIGMLGAVTTLLGLSALLSNDGTRFLLACACAAGYFIVFLVLASWRPGAIGGGDVKLAPAIGLISGWVHIDAALVLTPLALVAVTGTLLLVRTARGGQRDAPLPFGPALICAGGIGVIAGGIAAAHL